MRSQWALEEGSFVYRSGRMAGEKTWKSAASSSTLNGHLTRRHRDQDTTGSRKIEGRVRRQSRDRTQEEPRSTDERHRDNARFPNDL